MSNSSNYAHAKRAYRVLVPARLRAAAYQHMPSSVRRARNRLVARLESGAEHDEIYDAAYYRGLVDPVMARSAAAMRSSIAERWQPERVIDVGCGTGRLLEEFRSHGVDGLGLELSEAALAICRERGLRVEKLDLESQDPPGGLSADVVISTEVAEHLPAASADRFVALLTRLSNRVVLTAAQPGTGAGTDHVNEQPHHYWIEKFEAVGFRYLSHETDAWRVEWSASGVEGCFVDGVMLFESRRAHDSV